MIPGDGSWGRRGTEQMENTRGFVGPNQRHAAATPLMGRQGGVRSVVGQGGSFRGELPRMTAPLSLLDVHPALDAN